MSKSKKVEQDTTPYTNYSNYLKSVDTSNVDNTLGNLTSYALNQSENLMNNSNWYLPTVNASDWNFGVEASDEARQRAENATYQAYIDKLTPQFQQQTADLESSLINKGLPVGSEAYQRAMTDLQNNQNDALNQAAYQSVLNGQNAYTQSLNDQIAAGNFGNSAQTAYENAQLAANNAQQGYLQQIFNAMSGSPSKYENQQNIFSVDAGKAAVDYQNALANAKGGWTGALTGAIQGGIAGAMTGNPYAAAAGAGLGAYSGYSSNPYSGNSGMGDWTSLLQAAAKYQNAGSKKDAK